MKRRGKPAQPITPRLPAWIPARSLQESAVRITGLGRRMDRDRYLLGKEFINVQARLRHGQWLPWIEEHLDCSEDTVERWMRFAERCDDAGRMVPYREKPPANSAACGISKPVADALDQWSKVITRAAKICTRTKDVATRQVMLADLRRLVADLEAGEAPDKVVAIDGTARKEAWS